MPSTGKAGIPIIALKTARGLMRAANPALRSRESYYDQSLVGNAILAYHRHAPSMVERKLLCHLVECSRFGLPIEHTPSACGQTIAPNTRRSWMRTLGMSSEWPTLSMPITTHMHRSAELECYLRSEVDMPATRRQVTYIRHDFAINIANIAARCRS
jgi:hypothetical protein